MDVRDELRDDAFIEAIAPLDDAHIGAALWPPGGSRDTTLWRVV